MKTRFLTSVTTTLNPFSPLSKTPRLFLSHLPPNARQSIKVTVNSLSRADKSPNTLGIVFKDGKELKYLFDAEKDIQDGVAWKKELPKLADVIAEVDRHCRILGRKEDLGGSGS